VRAMAAKGIRRKVDDLGRIVVPAPYRRALGLVEGDELDVVLDGDRLVLRRAGERCTFCDAGEELTTFHGKGVCWSCAAAVRALDRERAQAPRSPFSS
jgi:AbrB family transcriptional regulator, transcriptional pleiotropic regulator of transition state genes